MKSAYQKKGMKKIEMETDAPAENWLTWSFPDIFNKTAELLPYTF